MSGEKGDTTMKYSVGTIVKWNEDVVDLTSGKSRPVCRVGTIKAVIGDKYDVKLQGGGYRLMTAFDFRPFCD